jgi:hypothetical protein
MTDLRVPPLAGVTAALLAVVGTVACSGLAFRSRVPDVVLTAASTAGAVCWVEGVERSTVSLTSATYRATATFDPGALAIGDALDVALFVRTTPPDASCAPVDAEARAIADPFTLVADEPTPIAAGDAGYGAVLADAVTSDRYWIGARVQGSIALTGDATVALTDGVVEARPF